MITKTVKQLRADQEKFLVENVHQNQAAFRDLHNHYMPKIYAYVSYRVGRVQDTEDLVADVFLAVVNKLHQFEWRGPGSFTSWLFRIARNRITDFYRQTKSRPDPLPLADLPDLQAETRHPMDAVLQKERFDHLRRLIDTLSPRRQEIITLRFFGELRNHEIADLLGLDERTVAAHLCRGLADLERKYKAELAQIY